MVNTSFGSAEVLEPETRAPAPQPRPPAPPADVGHGDAPAGDDVGLIDDVEGFAALKDDWYELFGRANDPTYFAGFDWNWSWWSWFGQPDRARPAIVTVRRRGRLAAVLPLAITRTGPIRAAKLMGAGTGHYGDALVDPSWDDPKLAADLRRGLALAGADTVLCDNVRFGGTLERSLCEGTRQVAGLMASVEVPIGGFVDIGAYMAGRAASLRKSLRRRRRNLVEELGPVSYDVVTDPARIAEVIGQLLVLKRRWLSLRGLHGRFLERAGVEEWLIELSRRAEATGNLHLSVLRVGGRAAAAQLAFLAGRRLCCYLSAFDPDLGRYAVGKLHLKDILADLTGSGIDLDLLPPADDYKREWGDSGTMVATHMVALTRRGRLVMALFGPHWRERAKAAYLALPDGLRAGVARTVLALLRGAGRLLARPGKPHSPKTAEDVSQ